MHKKQNSQTRSTTQTQNAIKKTENKNYHKYMKIQQNLTNKKYIQWQTKYDEHTTKYPKSDNHHKN